MKMEITFGGGKKVNAHFKNHVIETDQPEAAGGEDSAPTPFDLFLASMGTCAGIYVKGFCDNRNISAMGIRLEQDMVMDPETKLITNINIKIILPEDFPEKYKEALINTASLCTVKKYLANPPEIKVSTN